MDDDAGRRRPRSLDPSAAVRDALARSALLAAGDHVLVAVSGGPDSVALLHALADAAPAARLTLTVGHVHHGLRPEADDDVALVAALGARLGWPVRVARVTVPHGAGRSPEDAARTVRHAALARLAREAGATRIALAHTASDQAETVLMRVLQGAGPRGLAGIPARRGRVVRPLLGVTREAIDRYLRARGVTAAEDATNGDLRFLRNRIRHALLPLLVAHAGPELPAALCRTARTAREAVEALDALVRPRLDGRLVPTPVGWRLGLDALTGLPAGAVKALLRIALVEHAAPAELGSGLRAAHQEALARLVAARSGARVRLPAGVVVERGPDALWILAPDAPWSPVPLALSGETRVGPTTLTATLESAAIPAGGAAGWDVHFDADALGGVPPSAAAWLVRRRETGDRLVPWGGRAPVRVTHALARAGIPRLARTRWPVLARAGASGSTTILWLVGVRRSALAPLTGTTQRVLRLQARVADPGATKEVRP